MWRIIKLYLTIKAPEKFGAFLFCADLYQMKGLYQLMNEANKVTVRPFTSAKEITDCIREMFHNYRPREQVIIQTGLNGVSLVDFTFAFTNMYLNVKSWCYIPKRVSHVIEISLIQKHGLLKLRINTSPTTHSKYELFYGTGCLGKSDKLNFLKHFLK